MFFIAPRATVLHFMNVFRTRKILKKKTVKDIIKKKLNKKIEL